MFKIPKRMKNTCWKEHIKHIESKIAKNIGLLYKAKLYTDKHSLLLLYLLKKYCMGKYYQNRP